MVVTQLGFESLATCGDLGQSEGLLARWISTPTTRDLSVCFAAGSNAAAIGWVGCLDGDSMCCELPGCVVYLVGIKVS